MQTTFVIRNITSCKVIYGVNGTSHKSRNSTVEKDLQHVSRRFSVGGAVELGLKGRVERMEYRTQSRRILSVPSHITDNAFIIHSEAEVRATCVQVGHPEIKVLN